MSARTLVLFLLAGASLTNGKFLLVKLGEESIPSIEDQNKVEGSELSSAEKGAMNAWRNLENAPETSEEFKDAEESGKTGKKGFRHCLKCQASGAGGGMHIVKESYSSPIHVPLGPPEPVQLIEKFHNNPPSMGGVKIVKKSFSSSSSSSMPKSTHFFDRGPVQMVEKPSVQIISKPSSSSSVQWIKKSVGGPLYKPDVALYKPDGSNTVRIVEKSVFPSLQKEQIVMKSPMTSHFSMSDAGSSGFAHHMKSSSSGSSSSCPVCKMKRFSFRSLRPGQGDPRSFQEGPMVHARFPLRENPSDMMSGGPPVRFPAPTLPRRPDDMQRRLPATFVDRDRFAGRGQMMEISRPIPPGMPEGMRRVQRGPEPRNGFFPRPSENLMREPNGRFSVPRPSGDLTRGPAHKFIGFRPPGDIGRGHDSDEDDGPPSGHIVRRYPRARQPRGNFAVPLPARNNLAVTLPARNDFPVRHRFPPREREENMEPARGRLPIRFRPKSIVRRSDPDPIPIGREGGQMFANDAPVPDGEAPAAQGPGDPETSSQDESGQQDRSVENKSLDSDEEMFPI